MLKAPDTPAAQSVDVPLIDLPAQFRTIRGPVEDALNRLLTSQRFILGEPVEELESKVAELVGTRHAVGCASGTDALLLPLRLLGENRGGEVIVPAFTFFATAGAVHNAGLKPVFCDVSADSFNVTAASIDAAWSKRTVGVVPVHLFGQMAPTEEVIDLARSRGAWVLEDAAQAIGATQAGGRARAGGVATAAALSFFPTKNLGAFGDGGMITTNDAELARRLREYRVHGGEQMYRHDVVGTNSRLDALQAAVLLAKLPFLEGWTEARRRHAGRYVAGLSGVDGIRLPTTLSGNRHVYNQFTIRTGARDDLRRYLADRGVASGIYYPVPLHLQRCFDYLGYGPGDFPVAEALVEDVLSLPIYPELTEEQLDGVIDRIRDFNGAS